MYKVGMTKRAAKDAGKLEQAGMKPNAVKILRVIRANPYQNPPAYEKLKGFENTYSRRISRQHRLVYEVLPNADGLMDGDGQLYEGIVKVLRMWTHYE